MNKFKNFSFGVIGIALIVSVLVLSVLVFSQGVTIASVILPYLTLLAVLAAIIQLFVITPMLFFRRTREKALLGMIYLSYAYGADLWVFGFLATATYFGGIGLFIGLVLYGVGFVPIALVGAVINGDWEVVWNLIVLLLLTFGSRFLAIYLAERFDKKAEKYADTVLEQLADEFNSANELSKHQTPDTAIKVNGVEAQYEFLKAYGSELDLEHLLVSTMEINNKTYEVQKVISNVTGQEYNIYFDITSYVANVEDSFDTMLEERETKDRVTITKWLREKGSKNPNFVYFEAKERMSPAYHLVHELGKISIPTLMDEYQIDAEVASALIALMQYRGYIGRANANREYRAIKGS